MPCSSRDSIASGRPPARREKCDSGNVGRGATEAMRQLRLQRGAEFVAEEKEFSLPYQNGSRGRGSQPPEGTSASSTGTTPRQMKAGSEQSPSGTTSLTPREAARFSAARKRSRLILAAWA